jgi:hypothetical protein
VIFLFTNYKTILKFNSYAIIIRQLFNHMKQANYLLQLLIACMLMTVVSCGKNGTVGPQGSTGPIGQTGSTTTTNVIYSRWYTPSSYTEDAGSGTYQFYTDIAVLNITRDTLEKDTVLVYTKTDGYNPVLWPTNLVSQLPISVTYEEGTTLYTDTWSAVVTPGNIRIEFVDNRNLYAGLYYAHKFRYIIVRRGVHAIGSINTKNYEQVKQALHLPD